MSSVSWNLMASFVWDRLGMIGLIVVVVVAGVWQLSKRRKSREIFAAAEELLAEANRVVHTMLNAEASKPDDAVRREFEVWQEDMEARLQRLRRQRL